jgi:hypothetical protein
MRVGVSSRDDRRVRERKAMICLASFREVSLTAASLNLARHDAASSRSSYSRAATAERRTSPGRAHLAGEPLSATRLLVALAWLTIPERAAGTYGTYR